MQKNDIKAVEISTVTLMGVAGKFPLQHGNCFSVVGDDGKEYRIVNFVYENLAQLLGSGLVFPIDIRLLNDRVAVIHDKRIPSDWYMSRFCEVCCPQSLLPAPQLLRIEREIMQGTREEYNGLVMIRPGKPECVITP